MNNSSHKKNYSVEDIQNYLSGKLTPLQMNAMEKAALNDPLLAEAMEGYEGMQTEDWKNTLTGLKENFAQKQQGAKVVTLAKPKNNWLKAVAAVVIIGGLSAASYFLFIRNNKGGEIAKNNPPQNVAAINDSIEQVNTIVEAEKQEAKADNLTTVKTPAAKQSFTVIKDLTHLPSVAEKDTAFVYVPSKNKIEALKDVNADAEQKRDYTAVTTNATPSAPVQSTNENQVNNLNVPPNVEQERKRKQASDYFAKTQKLEDRSVQAEEIKLDKTYFAQVLSADNTPLPFANVNIKRENFGTYADVRGNFRLVSNDSVLNVEVKAAGFKTQMVTLKSNVQQNRIVLQEDPDSYTEKVVIESKSTGDKNALRRTAFLKDSVMNVEPVDGWDKYRSYADNNFQIPDDILKSNIHGQVELSFDVKPNGTITNIKVDKSLCANCDEAAIRLLQQGPQWKIKKGKRGKGKITVQF